MKTLAMATFLLGALGAARAADKVDLTGTWTLKPTGPHDKEIELTANIEHKDEKVTGTLSGAKTPESKIEDGKYKDGVLTFSTTKPLNKDITITIKYEAKLTGDVLKGTAASVVVNKGVNKEFKVEFEGTRNNSKLP